MSKWLADRVHISWFIGWFSLAVIVGIVLAAIAGTAHTTAGVCVVMAVSVAVAICRHRFRWMLLLAMIVGLLAGLWRGGIEQPSLLGYRSLYGKVVTLQGTVSDDASYGPGGDQRLVLYDLTVNAEPLPGQVWISTDTGRAIQRSDHVTLRGKLSSGFGSAAASMFHASVIDIARPTPGDIGLRVRDWFAGGIRMAIPDPESSLASGYLIGQRSSLPADLDAQLKTVGLTHAVVASGYNLTILVSLARQILVGTSKYLATLAAAAMVIGFMMISGLSPSMARAGLVTSLSMGAWYYGRKLHPIVLLPFAAAITAMVNPFYVWGDIGWYLSFASFAGVIVLAPILQHALWRGKEKPGLIAQVVIDTMSAQLATLPIMVFAFGHYSPYALLANLLVLPLIPLTMLLTFAAGVVGLAIPVFAHFAGLPADVVLRYMIWIVAHVADLPGAQGSLPIDGLVVAGSYTVMVIVTIGIWRGTGFDFRRPSGAESYNELPESLQNHE